MSLKCLNYLHSLKNLELEEKIVKISSFCLLIHYNSCPDYPWCIAKHEKVQQSATGSLRSKWKTFNLQLKHLLYPLFWYLERTLCYNYFLFHGFFTLSVWKEMKQFWITEICRLATIFKKLKWVLIFCLKFRHTLELKLQQRSCEYSSHRFFSFDC